MLTNITGVVEKKFEELMKVQEEHAKKMTAENNLLRSKLTTLMKNSRGSVERKEDPKPSSSSDTEPIWCGDINLMDFVPYSGPSAFGRCLAGAIFGVGEDCTLINQRIGGKLIKKSSLPRCCSDLEEKFRVCVERKFARDPRTAFDKACIGANQFGAEMRRKYPWKKARANKENETPMK